MAKKPITPLTPPTGNLCFILLTQEIQVNAQLQVALATLKSIENQIEQIERLVATGVFPRNLGQIFLNALTIEETVADAVIAALQTQLANLRKEAKANKCPSI